MKNLSQILVQNKNRIFIIIILLFFSFISHKIWYHPFAILTNGDWWYQGKLILWEIYSKAFNMRSMEAWFWSPTLDVSMKLPVVLFWQLTDWFWINYALGQRIFWFLPALLLSIYGSYKLFFYLFKWEFYSILVSCLLYNFNVYITIVQISGHMSIAVGYAFIPLLLYLYLKYTETNKNSDFIFWILTLFIFSLYELRISFIGCFIVFLAALYRKQSLQKIFMFFGLFWCLIAFWLIPIVFSWIYYSNELTSQSVFGNQFMSLLNSFALFHSFWWWWELVYFSINQIPVYFFLVPLVAFVSILLIKNKSNYKYYYLFLIFTLVGIFLTKQGDFPFPEFYQWAYDNIPLFNLYRESSKFYSILALWYSWLIWFTVYLFAKNNFHIVKKIITLLFLLYTIINLKPLILNEEKTLFVEREVPREYEFVNSIVSKDPHYSRILSIPSNSRWLDYWKKHPSIDLAYSSARELKANFSGAYYWENIKNYIPEMSKLSTFWYIFIRNTKNNDFEGDFWDFYNDVNAVLLNNTGLQRLFYSQNIALYKIQNTADPLLIWKDLSSFTIFNNSKIKLTIKNLKEKSFINYFQSFHPKWKLYLDSYTQKTCKKQQIYTGEVKNIETGSMQEYLYHVIECEAKKESSLIEWIKKLWETPIFDNTHQIVNGYANQRTLDADYIKKNFPKEYYKLNPDGSIDVNLTLYFKPQSYFYLGLCVSGITFFILLILLIRDLCFCFSKEN